LKVLLKECWERYNIPIAVTEVHINGHSDDQIRWFKEVWDICVTLNNEGLNITAVTAWALLGSYGWNHLLTQPNDHYEHGAFDLRTGNPESTPLVDFLRALSANPDHHHPALEHKGWWQHENRRLYDAQPRCVKVAGYRLPVAS
jgi:dTDP-4-dehydrorhamnose reductase